MGEAAKPGIGQPERLDNGLGASRSKRCALDDPLAVHSCQRAGGGHDITEGKSRGVGLDPDSAGAVGGFDVALSGLEQSDAAHSRNRGSVRRYLHLADADAGANAR